MSIEARPGRLGSRLTEHVRQPLLRNGYALVLNSGMTAVLGMGFWVLAARRFSVEEVGVSSALVASLALLSTIAQLNLPNVLARFLPTAGQHTGRVIAGCCLATGLAAVVVGVVFLAGTQWWAPSLPLNTEDLRLDAWFVAALVLWCLFVLQDGALSGLRQSDWVLGKNTAHGVLKLVALLIPMIAVSSYGIFLAWTIPVIPILLAVGFWMVRRLVPAHVSRTASLAQPVAPRQIVRFASFDYVVALVGTGLTSALPLIVLETSGAAAAAYFTLAWSISYSLYLVSRSMATSLLVEGAGDTSRLGEYSYRTMVHTLWILAPLVAATVLLAPVLMRMFGDQYAAEGTTVLRLLALSALPSAVIVVYSAVERVRKRMLQLVLVTVTVNATALALIWVLLQTHGLSGLGLAWLATQTVAAAILLGTTLGPMWLPHLQGRMPAWLVRVTTGARSAAHRRVQRRLLERRYPELAASLGLEPHWQIQRVFTTVGDVAVAEVGGSSPEAILKVALTDRGTEALLSSSRAVDSLSADPRLDGWVALLPQTLAVGHADTGRLVLLERRVAGKDGRQVIGSRPGEVPVTTVLDEIGSLHRCTGRAAVMDAPLLQTWVDEPVDALERWLAGTSPPEATRHLRERLRHELQGRAVTLSWTHGDLAPGNVIFNGDGRRAAAIIDWERARADGLPDVDTAHFLLAVRMLREDRELGDLVCDLVRRPGSGESVLGDPALVLLAWLDHVVGVISKTGHYVPGGLWAARNVHPVLRQVMKHDMSATVRSEVRSPVPGGPGRRFWASPISSLAELGVVVGLWVVTLTLVDPRAMTDLGLISTLPWTAVAALALMAFSFARTLARPTPGWLLTSYPLALSTLVFSTPPILYETPRYSWAWKHAGIVDFIDRTGTVDPQIDVLSVYHNWPGFFAANAMLSDLAGFDTSLSYAAWTELFVNLLTLSAVLALLRALTTNPRTIAVGGWLFVLGNWVGQGYFSPQGINFVWYLIVVAVLLRWFPGRSPASSPPDLSAARRVGLCAVVLLLLVSIASTHQLTPVVTVLTLAALVVLRQTSVRSLPVFMAVVVSAWVLYVAEPFTRTALRDALAEVGTVGSNLEGTLIGYGTASDGQILVSLATRLFTLGFCLLAGLGLLTSWRSGRRDYSALVLAVVPFLIVGFSTYGNEVVFRAYLFAMPGLAFFAAVLLWPPGTTAGRRRAALVGVVTLPLMLGSGFAQFGNDRQYYFTPEEVAAAEFVYDTAPPDSLLIEGSRSYPSQFRNYERFTYVPIAREDPEDIQRILDDPVQAMTRWMSDTDTYRASYLIITRSQIVTTTARGEIPGDGLLRIEEALRSSPEFRVVFENRDATVFQLATASEGESP
jgi:O-antigen/teichoic acid export membrane protein